MYPSEIFRHCPKCGVALGEAVPGSRLECAGCGFVYYFNPTVASACFINNDAGLILLVKRAKEPSKGKWAPPGGFIDIGERAEDGVRREIREEVGLDIINLQFLCSQPNRYDFRGVTYPVLDLFFTARTSGGKTTMEEAEVLAAEWVEPTKVSPADMAFPSMQAAFREYLARL